MQLIQNKIDKIMQNMFTTLSNNRVSYLKLINPSFSTTNLIYIETPNKSKQNIINKQQRQLMSWNHHKLLLKYEKDTHGERQAVHTENLRPYPTSLICFIVHIQHK
jgi:hypothetical protein